MRMLTRLVVFVLLIVQMNLQVPHAAQVAYGTIVGTVMDPQGAPAYAAVIVIENTQNGLRREATTDDQGEYRILGVSQGPYDLRIVVGTAVFRRTVAMSTAAGVRVDAPWPLERLKSQKLRDAQRVQVGLYWGYSGGGDAPVAAVGDTASFTGYISVTAPPCAVTASDREPQESPSQPQIGWRISGHVLGALDGLPVVRFEWQRLWDLGARQTSPPTQTVLALLTSGERFVLESIKGWDYTSYTSPGIKAGPAVNGCIHPWGARLEAALMLPPAVANDGVR